MKQCWLIHMKKLAEKKTKEFVKTPFNQEGLWLFLLCVSVKKNILLVNIKRFCHENSRYLILIYLP